MSIEQGSIVSQIGTVIVIAAVVVYLGIEAMSGNQEWGAVVAYLAMLRYAASNLTALSRSVTSMARLYPQVALLSDFVRDSAPSRMPGIAPSQSWYLAIPLQGDTDDNLWQRTGWARLRPGTINLVLAPPNEQVPLTLSLGCHARLRTPTGDVNVTEQSMSEVGGPIQAIKATVDWTAVSLREALAVPQSIDAEQVMPHVRELEGALCKGAACRLDAGRCSAILSYVDLDRVYEPPSKSENAAIATVVLQAAAARARGASLVLVESCVLDITRHSSRKVLRSLAETSVVAVAASSPETIDAGLFDGILVVRDGRPEAWCGTLDAANEHDCRDTASQALHAGVAMGGGGAFADDPTTDDADF